MTRREHARPIIAEVIRDVVGPKRPPYSEDEQKAIRKALVDAYPYGLKENHPYTIWCDEIKKQLGQDKRGKTIEVDALQREIWGWGK